MKNVVYLNEREAIDVELSDVDPSDYPDFCDAHISYAVWSDTGEKLTENELEELNNENSDVINQLAFEYYYG